MSEQQRIFLAMALCLTIFVVANALTPPAVQEVVDEVVSAENSTSDEPSPTTAENNDPIGTARPEGTLADDPSPEAPEEDPRLQPEMVRTIETPEFHAEVADHDARLVALELKRYQRHLTSAEEDRIDAGETIARGPVSLTFPVGEGELQKAPYQARVSWVIDGQTELRPMAFDAVGEGSLEAVGHDRGIEYSVVIASSSKPYALDYRLRAENTTEDQKVVAAHVGLRVSQAAKRKGSMFFGQAPQILRGYCNDAEGNLETADFGDLNGEPAMVVDKPQLFAGIDAHYFVAGLIGEEGKQGVQCTISTPAENAIDVDFGLMQANLKAGESVEQTFTLFVGPKRSVDMKAVDERLSVLTNFDFVGIPMGFVGRPMIALLNLFDQWVGSWGVAIILLTLFIKLALFPLTFRGQVAMRKMQTFKPELDAIKTRFPDDPERQRQEQVRLFQEKGYNPLGGCLPMVLQMPILISLYSSLRTTVELYQQPFLWLPDLTLKEPGFPFLALGLSALYFAQQFLTPMQTDNAQAKMMRWIIPVFIPAIMIVQPSGLLVYLLVSSAFTSLQQLVINKASPLPQKPSSDDKKLLDKKSQAKSADAGKGHNKNKHKGSTAKAGAR